MSCKTIVSLLMAGFFLCAASASAAPHTTLTIAMGDPESSEMGVVGNAFKKYVEDKTNGAIQVVCIYGGRRRRGTLPQGPEGHARHGPWRHRQHRAP